MNSENHPYPDTRAQRHHERMESDPAYRAWYVRRFERRREELLREMREEAAKVRRIIRGKVAE